MTGWSCSKDNESRICQDLYWRLTVPYLVRDQQGFYLIVQETVETLKMCIAATQSPDIRSPLVWILCTIWHQQQRQVQWPKTICDQLDSQSCNILSYQNIFSRILPQLHMAIIRRSVPMYIAMNPEGRKSCCNLSRHAEYKNKKQLKGIKWLA